jgi:hypothetical protein
MRNDDTATKSGTNFDVVWMEALISRSLFLSAVFRNAWRRLFGSSVPASDARRYLET